MATATAEHTSSNVQIDANVASPQQEAHPSTIFPGPPRHIIDSQMKKISETTEPPSSAKSMPSIATLERRRKSQISIKDGNNLTAKEIDDTQKKGMEHLRISSSKKGRFWK